MDEKFRDRRLWIGFGAVGIIFLCLMLCGMMTMAGAFLRTTPPVSVAPVVEVPLDGEGVAAPPVVYGPFSGHGGRSFSPFGLLGAAIGMLFKLAFMGLGLLLLIGLVKRIFWGPRTCGPRHWHKPPRGGKWEGKPHPGWGPWAWHGHGAPWEAEGEPGTEEGEPDADPEYGTAQ